MRNSPTPESDDLNQYAVVGVKNVRRKRLRIRQLKYTCRTKDAVAVAGGKFVSLSSPSPPPPPPPPSWTTMEEKEVASGFTRGSFGVLSAIGGRREMEDAVRAELGFAVRGGEECDFFAVFDGHGGAHVATACSERLHELVAEGIKNGGEVIDWENVMEGCFGKMDEEVSSVAAARTVGSTAVVAVVAEEEVVVANCGDCRAVLCRAGVPLALSTDHKPYRPDELMRIEAAGGRVINWNGFRVLGVLATSRSIGDQYLRPYVISKPEVTVTKRSEEDEFLILASDGLWDVISNEVACEVVRRCLEGKMMRRSNVFKEAVNESRASEAAAVLAELAMARGSIDNISVIVVELKKPS